MDVDCTLFLPCRIQVFGLALSITSVIRIIERPATCGSPTPPANFSSLLPETYASEMFEVNRSNILSCIDGSEFLDRGELWCTCESSGLLLSAPNDTSSEMCQVLCTSNRHCNYATYICIDSSLGSAAEIPVGDCTCRLYGSCVSSMNRADLLTPRPVVTGWSPVVAGWSAATLSHFSPGAWRAPILFDVVSAGQYAICPGSSTAGGCARIRIYGATVMSVNYPGEPNVGDAGRGLNVVTLDPSSGSVNAKRYNTHKITYSKLAGSYSHANAASGCQALGTNGRLAMPKVSGENENLLADLSGSPGGFAYLGASGTVAYPIMYNGLGVWNPAAPPGCQPARPRTSTENANLQGAAAAYATTQYIFLGARSTSGTWVWDDDGTPLASTYTNWAGGESGYANSYLCMRHSDGLWIACPHYSGNTLHGSAGAMRNLRSCMCPDGSVYRTPCSGACINGEVSSCVNRYSAFDYTSVTCGTYAHAGAGRPASISANYACTDDLISGVANVDRGPRRRLHLTTHYS
jgi:hypothetical protein